jgi:hypothetical protein
MNEKRILIRDKNGRFVSTFLPKSIALNIGKMGGAIYAKRSKGKTYEQIHGKARAEQIKNRQSLSSWHCSFFTKESRHQNALKAWKTRKERYPNGVTFQFRQKQSLIHGGTGFPPHDPYDSKFSEELKRLVRKNADFKCKICKEPEKLVNRSLSIHHLDKNKQNNKLSNLVAVCCGCHQIIHRH